jgi:hypothetical protein
MKVGIIAITLAPRNFPFTICHKLNGFVKAIQEFLLFFRKTAHGHAGIRKIKIHGAKCENGVISANPVFRIL